MLDFLIAIEARRGREWLRAEAEEREREREWISSGGDGKIEEGDGGIYEES